MPRLAVAFRAVRFATLLLLCHAHHARCRECAGTSKNS